MGEKLNLLKICILLYLLSAAYKTNLILLVLREVL